jgi:hypothetical protein
VERMLTDQGLSSAAVSKGTARARAFRWPETARRVLEVYRQAVARRAQRRS